MYMRYSYMPDRFDGGPTGMKIGIKYWWNGGSSASLNPNIHFGPQACLGFRRPSTLQLLRRSQAEVLQIYRRPSLREKHVGSCESPTRFTFFFRIKVSCMIYALDLQLSTSLNHVMPWQSHGLAEQVCPTWEMSNEHDRLWGTRRALSIWFGVVCLGSS